MPAASNLINLLGEGVVAYLGSIPLDATLEHRLFNINEPRRLGVRGRVMSPERDLRLYGDGGKTL